MPNTKHTLFLVHGMGAHEGRPWAKEVWTKLVECSKRYPFFENEDLDEWAEPVSLEYDGAIRRLLKRWDRQATRFGDFARSSGLEHADALEWLEGSGTDEAGFVWTHVVDVLVYYLAAQERARIQDKLQQELVSEVARKRAQDSAAEFSLLAHSLGTSVAHDALAELGSTERLGGRTNVLWARNFHFASIHLLANVSRLLQTKHKPYESVVRPGNRDGVSSYCLRMYCHRHELDPIPRPKAFEPVQWGGHFQLETLRHYRGWNVHGWLHYLDHPRVHIPILNSITRSTAIGRQAAARAMDDYPQFADQLAGVDAARVKLQELGQLIQGIGEDQDLLEGLQSMIAVWKGLGDLRATLDETWRTLEESAT